MEKREIKFKRWNGVEMEIEPFWGGSGGSVNNIFTFGRNNTNTYLQYTGLKDKNGIEIYEGDIIKYSNGTIAKVIFKDGAFCGYDGYASSSEDAYLKLICDEVPFMDSEFKFEIIGNIYKNPELLD